MQAHLKAFQALADDMLIDIRNRVSGKNDELGAKDKLGVKIQRIASNEALANVRIKKLTPKGANKAELNVWKSSLSQARASAKLAKERNDVEVLNAWQIMSEIKRALASKNGTIRDVSLTCWNYRREYQVMKDAKRQMVINYMLGLDEDDYVCLSVEIEESRKSMQDQSAKILETLVHANTVLTN